MIELHNRAYTSLIRYLGEITFNHLFARAVIERAASGRVYVDDVSSPHTFYIVHRYGMSLLGGDAENIEFNLAFREYALNTNEGRMAHEWMQVFPFGWNSVLRDLLGDKLITAKSNTLGITKGVVELNTRVNFAFDRNIYLKKRRDLIKLDPQVVIAETTKEIYDQMNGSVVPRAFWNTSRDLIRNGVSFSLYYEGKLAATSFSSFVAPGNLELGIETLPEFRGLGLAEKVCAALIDYCIDKNLEPIWACRLENVGSYNLAKKLGFVPTVELPYYRLSN